MGVNVLAKTSHMIMVKMKDVQLIMSLEIDLEQQRTPETELENCSVCQLAISRI